MCSRLGESRLRQHPSGFRNHPANRLERPRHLADLGIASPVGRRPRRYPSGRLLCAVRETPREPGRWRTVTRRRLRGSCHPWSRPRDRPCASTPTRSATTSGAAIIAGKACSFWCRASLAPGIVGGGRMMPVRGQGHGRRRPARRRARALGLTSRARHVLRLVSAGRTGCGVLGHEPDMQSRPGKGARRHHRVR